ncbi:hypothetical protein H310_05601 [Aphanomyces invadans]|uniref:Uncharacterized protein n=1 Tax=Aphanomyces invadans TaxID=157072 RepID=A0A024UBB2_9STRA|nr:hypothetical protein H310_05601 [Aphanomyces invadans]ETW03192.1 hypothetical protein H310_05601 [Aphanomyces invadans]|eukprot:XP_008868576.1 hypothetical protein H310_05601 [Aphanomyces invadans]
MVNAVDKTNATPVSAFPTAFECTGALYVGHIAPILLEKKPVPSKAGTWLVEQVMMNGDHVGFICHHKDTMPSSLLTRIVAPNVTGDLLLQKIGRYGWGYESLEANTPLVHDRFRASAADYREDDRLIGGGYFLLVDAAHKAALVPALDSLYNLWSNHRFDINGTPFGVTCRYSQGEYELAWIVKTAETGEMVGFVYDGSYSMFDGSCDEEYIVGAERVFVPKSGGDGVVVTHVDPSSCISNAI